MTDRRKAIADVIDDLRRVFQVTHEQSKRVQRETGVTGPQAWAVKLLAEGGPMRVSELAHRMYLHPATVVGILDRLERAALAVRARSTDDRRVVQVSLTDKGRELVARAPDATQGRLVEGLERLSDKELADVAAGLARLVDIFDAQDMPPHLILSPEVNLPDGEPKKAP